MSNIYEFGFTSSLAAISFPGAQILALDCSYVCPYLASDYEPFGILMPDYCPAFTPSDDRSGFIFPGVPTEVLLAGNKPLPPVVDPVSAEMESNLFVWERPATVTHTSLTGEATAFINLSLLDEALHAKVPNAQNIVSFKLTTSGHPVIYGHTDTKTGYICAAPVTEGPDLGNTFVFVVNAASPYVPFGHGVPYVSSMTDAEILFWAGQGDPPFFFALVPEALNDQLAFLNGSGSVVWFAEKVVIQGTPTHPVSGGTTWKIIASTYDGQTKFPLSGGGLASLQGAKGLVTVTGGAKPLALTCSVDLDTLGVIIM